jgi:hypothetical protein
MLQPMTSMDLTKWVSTIRPLARPGGRLALSLLLAGGEPAASSLRARHLPERTSGRVQLPLLG